MSTYLIYDDRTSAIVAHPHTRTCHYGSMAAAKAARTKMLIAGHITENTEVGLGGLISSWYNISESQYYIDHIERMVTVRNLMTGEPVVQSVNTPRSCDVSSNLYWSM